MSFSGTSTAASVYLGAAEAPREAGAHAAGEEEEVVSRSALAKGISRLATISGPAAQEEARVRALRRAQLLADLKEKTTGIPRVFTLWSELEAIEQVSAAAPLNSCPPWGPVYTLTKFVPCRRRTTMP